jgi:hypothetical protein
MEPCVAIPATTVANILMCVWGLVGVCIFGLVMRIGDKRVGLFATILWLIIALGVTIISRGNVTPEECSYIINP